MGQKVNPIGYRVGVTQSAASKWYAGKGEYGALLLQDKQLRDLLNKELETIKASADTCVGRRLLAETISADVFKFLSGESWKLMN